MYLDGDDLGKVLLLARLFGFNPVRSEWRKYDEPARLEGVSEDCIGWWLAFGTIGSLNAEEAASFAAALREARGWVTVHPGQAPDSYRPSGFRVGKTLADWTADPRAIEVLGDVVALAGEGPFAVRAWHWAPGMAGGCELSPIGAAEREGPDA